MSQKSGPKDHKDWRIYSKPGLITVCQAECGSKVTTAHPKKCIKMCTMHHVVLVCKVLHLDDLWIYRCCDCFDPHSLKHTHTQSSASCSMPWFWNPLTHSKKNYADYVSLCNAYRSYTKLPRSPMLRKNQPKSATSESEVQLFSWLLVPDDLHNGWLGGIGFSSPKGFNETGPRWHSYKQSQRTPHQNSRRNQQKFQYFHVFPIKQHVG